MLEPPMPRLTRRWTPAPDPVRPVERQQNQTPNDAAGRLTDALGVSPLMARLLVRRGMLAPETATDFLNAGSHQCLDYWGIHDLPEAVSIIHSFIQSSNPITIYGDYDVDGLTGSTILYWVLKKLTATVDIHIPHRNKDGYGLSIEAIRRVALRGTKLLITVDNGTTSVQEIRAAREMGMVVIVLDHHQPGAERPDVAALINPHQSACNYPFKGLASVGLAYKLGRALLERAPRPATGEALQRYADACLDLVAVGTIADMAPLTGENRALVREGLGQLATTRHPGLRGLLDLQTDKSKVVDSDTVAFQIAPRLNAASRIADPRQALSLLLVRDQAEGRVLARNLDALNRKRRRMVDQLYREALDKRDQWLDQAFPIVILPDSYVGLMGLIAQRLKDDLHRPVFALALKDGIAAGSGRSVPGYPLTEALDSAGAHTLRHGGHHEAAGVTVAEGQLEEFIAAMQAHARKNLNPDARPDIPIEAQLGEADLTADLIEELGRLEPHGMANPRPIFAVNRVRVRGLERMGQGGRHAILEAPGMKHLKILGYGLGERSEEIVATRTYLDLAGVLRFDRGSPTMILEDIRESQ